jgi:hypothetical protein
MAFSKRTKEGILVGDYQSRRPERSEQNSILRYKIGRKSRYGENYGGKYGGMLGSGGGGIDSESTCQPGPIQPEERQYYSAWFACHDEVRL